ncbi:hypothetical protein JCM33374_g5367 [Metschnikowia sp. JCM 33374]|nr:hypothetical protein JCM33374_g5367 [Metschnikowia sp. JCM 33374]
MLDEKSIEVISRFKSALLTRSQKTASSKTLSSSNRGKKFPSAETNPQALTPKIVEYDGSHHLVLTNEVIERTNFNNKRRWSDFYRSETPKEGASPSEAKYASDGDSDSDEDDDGSDEERSEENPLKKLRLSELLAPLAHPSELYSHPAISKTYKSTNLSVLAAEIIEIIEVEQNTLNHYNKLLQVLDGEDWYYQLEENMDLPVYDHGLDDSQSADQNVDGRDDANSSLSSESRLGNNENKSATENDDKEFENKRITRAAVQPETQSQVTDPFFALPKSLEIYERQQAKHLEDADEDDDEYGAIQQELINYLQVSIQRQHEYIKNLTTIRAGLVKADRYKKDLLRWGKEMSEKKY